VTHPERGTALLDRLAGELSEIAVVEQSPIQDGRNMTMLLAPSKAVLAGEQDQHESDGHAETRGKGSRRNRARAEAEAEAEAQANASNGNRRNGSASEPSDEADAASPSVASDEADS
jgi:translation initiation factor IF-3